MFKTHGRVISAIFLIGLTLNATAVYASSTEQAYSPKEYVQCKQVAASYAATVPQVWFQRSLQLVQTTPGYSPPVSARTLGYLGVTLYEAVVPGMPGYQSLADKLNGLEAMPPSPPTALHHWPTVANAALAQSMRLFFPTTSPENLAAVDALEQQFEAEFRASLPDGVVAASIVQGQEVAWRIFVWSQGDGGHDGYLRNQPESYTPPLGEGLWIPTPPQFGRALQPTWGNNRPMLLTSGAQCAPPSPPIFATSADSVMYQEGLDIYNAVKNLSPEQRDIALYWADNPGKTATPPGHMISIITQVIAQENSTLAGAALTYAKVGIAMNDAFIAAWHTKYQYNRIRPISYIQQVIDPTWNNPEITDPVTTPPFPSYTSGHSVSSGAAMTVLTALFGEPYQFTDNTHLALGFAPRTFPSFMAAGQEAALSRFYGGIHFRSDNEAGFDQGVCIGKQVNELHLEK